jgi:hypothetical protein
MPRVPVDVIALLNRRDIENVESCLRHLYRTDKNVPCLALYSASYFSFRSQCETHLNQLHDTEAKQVKQVKQANPVNVSYYFYLDHGVRLELHDRVVIVTRNVPSLPVDSPEQN